MPQLSPEALVKAIQAAARAQQFDKVSALLAANPGTRLDDLPFGSEVRALFHEDMSSLIRHQQTPLFKAILEAGYAPSSTKEAVGLLFDAIDCDDAEAARLLLGRFISPEAQNRDGVSALNEAVSRFKLKTAACLLEAGADPWKLAQRNSSVLGSEQCHAMGALTSESYDPLRSKMARKMARLLVPHVFSRQYWAGREESDKLRKINQVPEKWREYAELADNGQMAHGDTISRYDFLEQIHDMATSGQLEAIPAFLAQHPTISLEALSDSALRLTRDILAFLDQAEEFPLIEALLDRQLTTPVTQGSAILCMAARDSSTKLVNTLLQRGVPAGAENIMGTTPLLVAVYFKRAEAAEALLKAGANPWEQHKSLTIDTSCVNNRYDALEELIKAAEQRHDIAERQEIARVLISAAYSLKYIKTNNLDAIKASISTLPKDWQKYANVSELNRHFAPRTAPLRRQSPGPGAHGITGA